MTTLPGPRNWMDDFTEITGDSKAGKWVCRVQLKLIMAGVPVADINRILHKTREEVLLTKNSPEDLFGPADEYAADCIGELNMSGTTFTETQITWRESLLISLWLAAFFTSGCGIVDLMTSLTRDWGPGDVIKPLCLVLGGMIFTHVWDWLSHRCSQWISAISASFAAFPFILAPVASYHSGGWGVHSTLWWFALAAVFALSALLIGHFLPGAAPRPICADSNDEWLAHAESALRLRDDHTSKHIHELLDEAKIHSTGAQVSLSEEFGDPRGYAHSLPAQPSIGLRTTAILMSINVVVIAAFTIISGLKLWSAILLGLAILGLVAMWVGYALSRSRR